VRELGSAWITENEQGQRFLTPPENLLTRIEQVLEKFQTKSQISNSNLLLLQSPKLLMNAFRESLNSQI
jgi:hypothetical protein